MSDEFGCEACRIGVYGGGEPTFVAITSPADLLYRCRACETWWVGDGHAAWPVSPDVARERFPKEVAP